MSNGQETLFQGEFTGMGKLWRRAIAYVADGFVLMVPIIIIAFGYIIFMVPKGNFANVAQFKEPGYIKLGIFIQIVVWAIFLVYFSYFVGKTGQTPGKKAMGIKVVNTEGNIIGYKRAFLRYLVFIIYGLGPIGAIISIISAIMAAVDKHRRTLHDRLCNTIVVGTETEPAIEKIRQEGKQRISGPAIFGLILSIFCIVIPIVGQLICFYVCGRALYDIKQSNGLLKGKSLAIAGLAISTLLLIVFILFLLVIPAKSKWKTAESKKGSQKINCPINRAKIELALTSYYRNRNYFPPSLHNAEFILDSSTLFEGVKLPEHPCGKDWNDFYDPKTGEVNQKAACDCK